MGVIIPIVETVIANLPGVIALIRAEHAARNPNAPALTDEQVKAGLALAIDPSLEKDAAWLAAHPETQNPDDVI